MLLLGGGSHHPALAGDDMLRVPPPRGGEAAGLPPEPVNDGDCCDDAEYATHGAADGRADVRQRGGGSRVVPTDALRALVAGAADLDARLRRGAGGARRNGIGTREALALVERVASVEHRRVEWRVKHFVEPVEKAERGERRRKKGGCSCDRGAKTALHDSNPL